MSPEQPITSPDVQANTAGDKGSKPAVPDHELIRCIGAGGYGEVWLARNVLGTYRAVKVVYRKSFRDERTYEREFRGIQQFEPVSRTNDGLLDILQAGRNDEAGYYYYVMELADDTAPVAAEVTRLTSKSEFSQSLVTSAATAETYLPKTLSTVVQQRGRLSPAECVSLGLNLTLALGHLHRHGLIHRDIKPANIIFVHGIPKLADIGLVTTFDNTCSFVGTEGFIAPEGPTSPRADLFSLGKVLYEISTGKDRKDFPEPATCLGERPDDAFEELNAIILKACATGSHDRYQSAEEMHVDLALVQSGKSVKSKRLLERRLAFARKAAALVGGVAAIAVAAYVYQQFQTREAKRLQAHAEDLAARMQVQNAENSFTRGDSALGLAHLAQVLRRQPDNRVAAERLMAALRQRNYPLVIKSLLHDDEVRTAHFSPGGKRIATTCRDRIVRLWDAETGELTLPPLQHSGGVNSVEFSRDGLRLLTASNDKKARVWDVRNGTLALPTLDHTAQVYAATFSFDGRWIATAAADGKACIGEAVTGDMVHGPLQHEGPVTSVVFSPDSQWLATGSSDGTVGIWKVASGGLKQRFRENGPVALVRFSGNGKWLAATIQGMNGPWRVQVWNVEAGRLHGEPLLHQNKIYSLAFSPDDRRLVTATGNNVARVWDVAAGNALYELQHSGHVEDAVFSPDGRHILTASADYTARVWDSSTGSPISEPLHHDSRVMQAEFSRDGSRVVTASWDKTVKLWKVPTAPVPKTFGHHRWVVFAEFDLTGRELITTTGSAVFTANGFNRIGLRGQQAVTVWTMDTGASAPAIPENAEALTAQFTQIGPRALIADRQVAPVPRSADESFSNEARIWNLAKGAPIGETIRHRRAITCAQFSAGGLKLATGCTDGAAMIWDAQQGVALTPLSSHGSRINSVRFSPDGATLVTASDGGTVTIWDTASGQRRAGPLQHTADAWFAQFSPDGSKVVSVALDKTARIWSTNGELRAVLQHSAPVEYAEFSPDGMKVVTAAGDHTARIWSAVTGKRLTELEHADVVLTARFSPDGLRVVTASMDRTAQLWDVVTGLRLAEPFRHKELVVSANFSRDGRQVVTASVDGTAKIWEVLMATPPMAAWLMEAAEAVGGKRLNHDGIPESVSGNEYANLKERLRKLSETNPGLQWAGRLFDPQPSTTTSRLALGEAAMLGPPISYPNGRERGPCLSSDGRSLYYGSDFRPVAGSAGDHDLWMTTRASLESPWEAPVNLAAINTTGHELFPAISADDRSLFFSDWFLGFGVPRPGGFGNGDLWVSTRENSQAPWRPALNLGSVVNTAFVETTPAISSNGLTLIFISDRPGNVPGSGTGRNALDFWMTTRTNASDPIGWGPPIHLGAVVNSIYADESPHLSRDGLALYFTSNRPNAGRPVGNYDLWVAKRPSVAEPFGAPESLAGHFSDFYPVHDPCLSPDGTTLFFQSRGLLTNSAPAGDLWWRPVFHPTPVSISRIVARLQP